MKITLCGDPGEGKKIIAEKYIGKKVLEKLQTIGADAYLKEEIIDGRAIKFQIWNLASQTRFGAVRSVYYLGALGGVLLFDVTKRETFENLENWIKDIWNNNGKGVIPLVIIGYNIDKRDQYPDAITDEMAIKYCAKLTEQTKENGFEVKYYPTSTKTGENIKESFQYLGKIYFQYLDKNTGEK